MNLQSGAWVGDYSGWTLKFRATYLAGMPQDTLDAMHALLEAAEPARTHLAACAKVAVPERTGRPITDATEAYGIGTVVIGGHYARRDTPQPDPEWCAEAMLPSTNFAVLALRNIGEHDASMAVLKLTPATEVTPEPLYVIASEFATAGVHNLRGLAETQFTAHFLMGNLEGTPAALAFYEDAPTLELLVPVIDQFFQGDLTPAVHVSPNGVFMLGPLGEGN